MNAPARHGRNFAWLAGAECVQRACSLVLFVYLNYALTTEENGWYGLIVAAFPVLVVAVNLGFSDVITRDVAAFPARAHAMTRAAWRLQPVSGLLVVLAAFGAARLLAFDTPLTFMLSAGAVAAIFLAMSRVNFAVFAARERFEFVAGITVVLRILIVIASIVALELGASVTALIALLVPAYALQWAIGSVLSRQFREPDPQSKPLPLRSHLLREGWPMAVGGLAATALIALDLPLLYALGEEESAGFYALGIRFYLMLAMVPELFGTLFYPIFSRNSRDRQGLRAESFAQCTKLIWCIAAPIAVTLSLCTLPVLATLAGEQYTASAGPVRVLALVFAIEALNYTAVIFLRANGKQRTPMLYYLVANALKILLALLLVPQYGTAALLAISLAISLTLTIFLFASAARALGSPAQIKPIIARLLRPTLAAGALIPLLLPLNDKPLLLIAPVAIVGYLIAFLVFRVLDDNDKRFLREAASSLFSRRD